MMTVQSARRTQWRNGLTPCAAALLALASTLCVTVARAQSPSERAEAESLFRRGRALIEQRKVTEACGRFAESQRLDPATGTLLALAQCHEREGKTATAWREYTEVLVASEKSGSSARHTFARARIEALEPSLVRLRVSVTPRSASTAGLVVKVDGTPLGPGSFGMAIAVDPGEHRLSASAVGYQPWSAGVVIDAREVTVNVPALEPLPTEPGAVAPRPALDPTPPTAPVPNHVPQRKSVSSQKAIGFTVTGVGLLGAGPLTAPRVDLKRLRAPVSRRCRRAGDGVPRSGLRGALSGRA